MSRFAAVRARRAALAACDGDVHRAARVHSVSPMRHLILLAALFLSFDAYALFELKQGYSKVWARAIVTRESAEAVARGLDAEILRVYPTHPNVGGATLMYVRDSDLEELNRRVYAQWP